MNFKIYKLQNVQILINFLILQSLLFSHRLKNLLFFQNPNKSNNQKKQNKFLIEGAERQVNVKYLQTMIAKYLACEFRNDIKKSQYIPPATSLKYELLDKFYGVILELEQFYSSKLTKQQYLLFQIILKYQQISQKYLYAETDINLEMKWEKISNNSSFLDKDKRIYGTFSHFTHFITDGALIITDLQGKGSIIFYFAIHTTGEGLPAQLFTIKLNILFHFFLYIQPKFIYEYFQQLQFFESIY